MKFLRENGKDRDIQAWKVDVQFRIHGSLPKIELKLYSFMMRQEINVPLTDRNMDLFKEVVYYPNIIEMESILGSTSQYSFLQTHTVEKLNLKSSLTQEWLQAFNIPEKY